MAFVLLPQLGLADSLLSLAWGNLVVAGVAALVPGRSEPGAPREEPAPPWATASLRFSWFALGIAGGVASARRGAGRAA